MVHKRISTIFKKWDLLVTLGNKYGTAQRQLDTRTRSTGRTPAVKISSAHYVHAGTRKSLPVTSIPIVSNVCVYCLFTRARV